MNTYFLSLLIMFWSGYAFADYDLKAHSATNLIFASLPIAQVEVLVNPGLREAGVVLDPNAASIASQYYSVPAGNYPVMIFQAVMSNITNSQDELFSSGGRPLISFNQIAFLIPHVQYKGKSFNHVRRLFVDNNLVVQVARAKYGYDKLLGEFSVQTSDTIENTQISYKGQTVADIKVDTSYRVSGVNFRSLLTALFGEDYLSFQTIGLPGVVCTHQSFQLKKDSLYPISAKAEFNKGYFTPTDIGLEHYSEPLFSFDERSPAIRIVYDWDILAPDYGCKK